MNNKFDELAKGLAQSVTRRQALRHFRLGLTGALLASIGLAPKAEADPHHGCKCKKPDYGCKGDIFCMQYCGICCAGGCI